MGVFKDAYYARLPDTDNEIASDVKSFHVGWKTLNGNEEGEGPGPREMHGTCVIDGKELILVGGRNEEGLMFADAWKLTLQTSIDTDTDLGDNLFTWKKIESIELPFKCCSHTLNVISGTDGVTYLCLFGGFHELDGNVGISGDIYMYPLSSLPVMGWRKISYDGSPIYQRFGHCSTEICCNNALSVIIFGGVKEDEDLSDVWIIEAAS